MAEPSLLAALVEELAERVAQRVVEKLTADELTGFVDQSTSPLGRRRHIEAVRSGRLPGRRLGRRYIAKTSDVEAYIASTTARADRSNESVDDVDALAAELGLESRPHANRKK
jgi:hypothetical protein